jgi:hypothetical protein
MLEIPATRAANAPSRANFSARIRSDRIDRGAADETRETF